MAKAIFYKIKIQYLREPYIKNVGNNGIVEKVCFTQYLDKSTMPSMKNGSCEILYIKRMTSSVCSGAWFEKKPAQLQFDFN